MATGPGTPRSRWTPPESHARPAAAGDRGDRPAGVRRPVDRSTLWDENGSPNISTPRSGTRAPRGISGRQPVERSGWVPDDGEADARRVERARRDPDSSGSGRPPRGRTGERSSGQTRTPRATASSSARRPADEWPPVRGRGSEWTDGRGRRRHRDDGGADEPVRVSADRRPAARRTRNWRIVLIPILAVLTVIVLLQVANQPDGDATASDSSIAPTVTAATSPVSAAAATGADGAAATGATGEPSTPSDQAAAATTPQPTSALAAATTLEQFLAAGALPDGPAFPETGPGTWHVVPGTTPVHGSGGQAYTYTVEVEDGIESPEADAEFGAAVDAALSDQRSWVGSGQVTMARVDSGTPSFRVTLASQMTIRSMCGFDIPLESSCFNGSAGRVMINIARWTRGAATYGTDLPDYRNYAINHEVGHALGYGHEPCKANGAPAPVMMQQSWSVSNDQLNFLNPQLIPRNGAVCMPNPYPFPDNPAGTAPSVAAG